MTKDKKHSALVEFRVVPNTETGMFTVYLIRKEFIADFGSCALAEEFANDQNNKLTEQTSKVDRLLSNAKPEEIFEKAAKSASSKPGRKPKTSAKTKKASVILPRSANPIPHYPAVPEKEVVSYSAEPQPAGSARPDNASAPVTAGANPHPWFGACDRLMPDGSCSECTKITNLGYPPAEENRTYSLAELREMRERGETESRPDAPTIALDEEFWEDANIVAAPITPPVTTPLPTEGGQTVLTPEPEMDDVLGGTTVERETSYGVVNSTSGSDEAERTESVRNRHIDKWPEYKEQQLRELYIDPSIHMTDVLKRMNEGWAGDPYTLESIKSKADRMGLRRGAKIKPLGQFEKITEPETPDDNVWVSDVTSLTEITATLSDGETVTGLHSEGDAAVEIDIKEHSEQAESDSHAVTPDEPTSVDQPSADVELVTEPDLVEFLIANRVPITRLQDGTYFMSEGGASPPQPRTIKNLLRRANHIRCKLMNPPQPPYILEETAVEDAAQ